MPKPSESCERVMSVSIDIKMFGNATQAEQAAVDAVRRVLLGHEVARAWFLADLPSAGEGDTYEPLDLTEARRLVSGK